VRKVNAVHNKRRVVPKPLIYIKGAGLDKAYLVTAEKPPPGHFPHARPGGTDGRSTKLASD
jgi:hypothetical protein